jgi:hypothetical protein
VYHVTVADSYSSRGWLLFRQAHPHALGTLGAGELLDPRDDPCDTIQHPISSAPI